jgi:hypothetical protein
MQHLVESDNAPKAMKVTSFISLCARPTCEIVSYEVQNDIYDYECNMSVNRGSFPVVPQNTENGNV